MERAAMKFASWFVRKFDISREVVIFAGPGNNGGDGLAAARLLAERNFRLRVFLLDTGKGLSQDCSINLERLETGGQIKVNRLKNDSGIPELTKDARIIDAVFGSGLTRPVSGLAAEIIRKMNSSGATIISIDIPSGLFGEDNSGNTPDTIVRAKHTITFEFPFLSFFFPENEKYTGNWKAVSIGLHPGAIKETPSDYILTDRETIKNILREKSIFSHKGSNGHALMIAGCYGMMGAAVLANRACLRTGAGLVTAHIPRFGYNIIQTAVPEALVSLDQSDIIFTEVESLDKYSAVGIGPGLNCKSNTSKGVMHLISQVKVPLVLDADALNIISADPERLAALPENTILTPHPGEFDRIAGKQANAYQRHLKQKELSVKHKLIIVLKGRYTMISLPDGRSFINPTGNPGLATGGSGDVLTGIIVSMLAQGYSPEEAAVAGVYIHGLAADIALEDQSYESLLPSDVIEHIGRAFLRIRE